MKRLFDIIFSFFGIVILLPLGIIVSLLIVLSDRGAVFYMQNRVGRNNKDFMLYKFRTMKTNSDKMGLLTTKNDDRITKIGKFLRKYKLDELPQLINVLKGDMSIVGPRPEVRKYVSMYNEEQIKVLSVKPGLTDYASLEFINENEMLEKSVDFEKTYIENIMPIKLELNRKYIDNMSLLVDIKIIYRTLAAIFKT